MPPTTRRQETGDDSLISQYTSSGEYYYLTDNIGSVLALVDSVGTQVAAYTYDPYSGHATVGAASSPNTNIANANPYRYAGTYFDATTGVYAMGARYYDPLLARFTQRDPHGQLLDLNQGARYSYAGDDPINATDPTGYCSGFFGCLKLIGSDFVTGAGIGGAVGGCAIAGSISFGVGCPAGAGALGGIGVVVGGAIGFGYGVGEAIGDLFG